MQTTGKPERQDCKRVRLEPEAEERHPSVSQLNHPNALIMETVRWVVVLRGTSRRGGEKRKEKSEDLGTFYLFVSVERRPKNYQSWYDLLWLDYSGGKISSFKHNKCKSQKEVKKIEAGERKKKISILPTCGSKFNADLLECSHSAHRQLFLCVLPQDVLLLPFHDSAGTRKVVDL